MTCTPLQRLSRRNARVGGWFAVVAALLLVGSGGVAGAATVTLQPVAATRVSQANPNTAYGGAADLAVSRDEFLDENFALVRFDLSSIPANAVISGAELGLYLIAASDPPPASALINVYRATQAWNASTVTWNTRPVLGSTSEGSASIGTTLNRYYTWSITDLVAAFVSAPANNHGFALRGPASVVYIRVFVGNKTANAARLRVDYTVPTPTRTATRTRTRTRTPTRTQTRTASATRTRTPSPTRTATASPTPANTPTSTQSATASATPTPTVTRSATPTLTATPTPTRTQSPTASATVTATVTGSATPTLTATATATSTPSPTPSATLTPTATVTDSPTPTLKATAMVTSTPSPSASATLIPTATSTVTATSIHTASPTPTLTPMPTQTITASATLTQTQLPSPTHTNASTATATSTPTPTRTATLTATLTPTAVPSATVTPSATATRTPLPAPTPTPTTACALDPLEPNDRLSDASQIQPDTESHGLICPPGDHDFFKVSLTAGTRVRVQLYDLPADYQLSLYGPGGQWLDQSSNKGRMSEDIRHTAATSGDYYLRVAPRGMAFDALKRYTLRVAVGDPMLQVFPGLGLPGSVVRLHGEGLPPMIGQNPCAAAVYWNQETPRAFLGRVPIGADGSLDLDFRIPSDTLLGTQRVRTIIGCGSMSLPALDTLLDADTEFPDDGCAQGWPPAMPELDLTVLGMEVTQGIQCFDPAVGDTQCKDNSVPLVAGRPTIVRLYVAANLNIGESVSGVTARLYVRRAGDEEPGTPLGPANGPIGWRSPHLDSLDAKRATENGTLNFRLPPEWTSAGALLLRAEVNPDMACGPYESADNRANNWGTDVTVDFQEHGPLTIQYVPVAELGGERPDDRVNDAAQWLYKVWPVADPPVYEQRVHYNAAPLVVEYDLDELNEHPQWLMADLNDIYAPLLLAHLFGGPLPPRILFGWVPTGDDPSPPTYGYSDPAWDDAVQGVSVVAWHRDMPNYFEKGLVHESGHDFNRHHAGVTDHWPDYYPDTSIQEIGFDVGEMQVKSADLWDVMNTGSSRVTSNSWVSPYTYKGLFAAEPWGTFGIQRSTRAVSQEYVVIPGEIRRDQTGRLEPIYRISSSIPPPVRGPRPGSDYCIQFVDRTGGLLSSRCFNASFVDEHNDTTVDTAPFLVIEPYPAGTTHLRLMKGQALLDERTVSANSPQVSVLTPDGGEQWDGLQTISWQATDADGDPLTSSVFYSPDGQSWRLVATGLRDQQLRWDTTQFGGGEAARVRVVATDGLNTAFDDSDSAFRIARKGPAARIASPNDGTTFRRPEAVFLLGQGSDLEDGELRGGALVWSSDRDGFLGTGNHIVTPELSRGRHVVSLTVTDRDGSSGTASVTIEVAAAMPTAECAGDCRRDGVVTVDELLIMVNVALGSVPTSACLVGDAGRDGEITVDEILTAVNHALSGCAP